jgi:hypothetical protein
MKKTHSTKLQNRILTRTLAQPIRPLDAHDLKTVSGGVETWTPGYEVDDYDLDGRW